MKAGGGIAVVHRDSDPQRRLLVATPGCRGIVRRQHLGPCRKVAAGVERVLDGKAEPPEVLAVDLREAEIDVGARSDQLAGLADRFGLGRRLERSRRLAIDADGQGIETALDAPGTGSDSGSRVRRICVWPATMPMCDWS